VYLDTSTLGDAFPGAFKPCPELTAAVELAANLGTLCFSAPHIIEVTALQPRERSVATGQWLDSLDPHWLSVTTAADDELTHAVRRELGLTIDPPRLPIHKTMTGGLRGNMKDLTPAGTVDILADPTFAGFIRKAHGRLTESKEAKIFSVEAFKALHGDRASLKPGTTLEDVRRTTEAKFVRYLKNSGA
jgi:hypothetical protein